MAEGITASRTSPEGQAPDAETRWLLEIDGLTKEFGGVHAVDHASLGVPQGAIVGLIGPNGAGKSTVLNMVAGELTPTAGCIVFDGHDITGRPTYKLAGMGLIRTFQIPGEFSSLTALDNLLLGTLDSRDSMLRALGGPRLWRRKEAEDVARARKLLARFHMTEKEAESAGNLSGGQKRLLEIMRALMGSPRLLLMDEPFAGVAPPVVEVIEERLKELRASGLTILVIGHELKVLERLTDSVTVMARGRVIRTGTMEEIRSDKLVREAYLV
ncbi:MAG: ABC transporter ATP-binding protein [Actinomycetota bacterium]